MKDKFDKELKVGDYIAYPNMNYADIKIGIITKITKKHLNIFI
jgi:hypothetical protein